MPSPPLLFRFCATYCLSIFSELVNKSTDGTASHSTRRANNALLIAGYARAGSGIGWCSLFLCTTTYIPVAVLRPHPDAAHSLRFLHKLSLPKLSFYFYLQAKTINQHEWPGEIHWGPDDYCAKTRLFLFFHAVSI